VATIGAGHDSFIGKVFGHYRILAKLGGRGVVYEAEDTRLRRNIARKTRACLHVFRSAGSIRFKSCQLLHDL
jgi:hypothetical protein